jgi:hypothetical protein
VHTRQIIGRRFLRDGPLFRHLTALTAYTCSATQSPVERKDSAAFLSLKDIFQRKNKKMGFTHAYAAISSFRFGVSDEWGLCRPLARLFHRLCIRVFDFAFVFHASMCVVCVCV